MLDISDITDIKSTIPCFSSEMCRWLFPIGKRQEHIFIGFLLTKTQLSPDDSEDDDVEKNTNKYM